MEVGLKHLFYAFALVWALHLGYVLNLAARLKRLSEELRALRKTVGGTDGGVA